MPTGEGLRNYESMTTGNAADIFANKYIKESRNTKGIAENFFAMIKASSKEGPTDIAGYISKQLETMEPGNRTDVLKGLSELVAKNSKDLNYKKYLQVLQILEKPATAIEEQDFSVN